MTRRARSHSATAPQDGTGLVTIEMVAHAAGVSPSTVSRILNGTAVVSAAKARAVEAAIAALGYVPSPVARGLAGGRTLSLGVITQSLDSPFYGAALRGIEIELQRIGYSPLFISGQWNAAEEARCVGVLRARRVDGIVMLDARLDDAALVELSESLPLVLTGRALSGPRLASLQFDNVGGAREATRYLIGLGHRRIAFIAGDPLHQDAIDRQRGYLDALAEHGIAADPLLVAPGDYSERSGLDAIEVLQRRGAEFTAVFAGNDQMALGAMLGLYRKARRVPADVSVVGFDDLQAGHYAIPPLTSVHQPSLEIGELAVRLMSELLDGGKPAPRVLLPRLVVRESAAPPRPAAADDTSR